MLKFAFIIPFLAYLLTKCILVHPLLDSRLITTKTFMFWPNATVPFYINPDHFDFEQTMAIMTALSTFAFKTCIKFFPVLTAPELNQHVLSFVNPDGLRRCKLINKGHSNYVPHLVVLGYDCLQSPQIDMIIMRALGFPFEHNRMSRDVYIEVLIENVEPASVELFAKDSVLPPPMRALPYDINSVMHFGERDFSKNGHRTIIFKSQLMHQNRDGLSTNDLRKIELVYGPECRQRDRQDKVELCQSYPGLVRRKRDVDTSANKSLRVNRNITPPHSMINKLVEENNDTQAVDNNKPDFEIDGADHVTETLKSLGIANETESLIEQVYKVSALALKNARENYCNSTKNSTNFNITGDIKEKRKNNDSSDILGILEVIANYAKSMVDHAISNLTIFCESSQSIEDYQRQCNFGMPRCPKPYRSTKTGAVWQSTKHAPVYKQQTRHEGRPIKASYDKFRRIEDSEVTTPTLKARRKRELIELPTAAAVVKEKKIKEKKVKDKSKSVKELDKKPGMDRSKKDKQIEGDKPMILEKKTAKGKLKKDTKVEDDKVNAGKDKKDDNIARRFFKERRYKAKSRDDSSGTEWDDSNVSMDKASGTIVKEVYQKDPGIDTDHKKGGKNGAKEIDLEAEKLSKDDFVKEAINEGLESILDDNNEEKNNEPSAVEDNEAGELEEDGEKNDLEDEERESEKESLEVEKSEEKSVEEIEEEVTTVKSKKGKRKKEDLELPVDDEEDEVELKTKEKKKSGARTKKRRRHEYLPETVRLNKLNKEFYNERRWPDGVVRYVIKKLPGYDLEDLRNRLAEVNGILMRKTCVKLVEVDAKTARGYDDYLILDNSPDYVTGRVGGKQIFGCVELFQGGQHKQHTAMMVMAMLGFYFEVSRHDRDRHIRVHMRHVRPDKLHHFEKIRDEATLDLPYDYKSATHPAWQFWRKIGKTGISTVATYKEHDPDGSVMRSLGQNKELLSEYDIIKINSVYGVQCFQNQDELAERNRKKKNKKQSKRITDTEEE